MTKVRAIADDICRVRDGRLANTELPSLLFHGAPGTGKTLLARSLAKSVGLPFISTSVGDWFSGRAAHLGTVIGTMREFFERAAASAPCIAFIDEIDGLPDRSRLDDRDREWWTPVVTTALVSIDRLRAARRGVVLVAATNHYPGLDPALIRPGRLDIHLEIVSPTRDADFQDILRQHLGSERKGSDLTAVARAAVARGATGATAEAWVRAARERARAMGRALALADLMAEAVPASDRSPAQDVRVAIHEAGHAVIGHVLGYAVEEITLARIDGREGRAGFADGDAPHTREDIERRVVVGMAGMAADELLNGGAEAGAIGDLAKATGLVCAIHGAYGLGQRLFSQRTIDAAVEMVERDPDLKEIVEDDLHRLTERARHLVRRHEGAIRALAETLVKNRFAGPADVEAAILADPGSVTDRIWKRIAEPVEAEGEEFGPTVVTGGAPVPGSGGQQ